ncbi:MAG TPA: hypothetical protein VGQ48_09495 [Gemmatimonadales bacterium]|jgi:hypothetical protein|nr:hypothetical protein [Gemmatimonadales bacterium]
MLRIRRLGRRTLDVEFPIGRGISCRLVERPGVWMDDQGLAQLSAGDSDLWVVNADGANLPPRCSGFRGGSRRPRVRPTAG